MSFLLFFYFFPIIFKISFIGVYNLYTITFILSVQFDEFGQYSCVTTITIEIQSISITLKRFPVLIDPRLFSGSKFARGLQKGGGTDSTYVAMDGKTEVPLLEW